MIRYPLGEPVQLRTPQIALSSNDIIYWARVYNATSHTFFKNGQIFRGAFGSNATSFNLDNLQLPSGTHAFTLRAFSNHSIINNSYYSNAVYFTVTQRQTPTNLRIETIDGEDFVLWDTDNARRTSEIFINGQRWTSSPTNYFRSGNIPAHLAGIGRVRITIRANGEGRYAVSEMSSPLYLNL